MNFRIVGYHGCDRSVALNLVTGRVKLRPGTGDYDWLGTGVYFLGGGLGHGVELGPARS